MTRTKIICTIGPAVNSLEKIQQLIDAGMNVARLNFSHGTHEEHRKVIENLKKAREEKKVPLAIMLDTKGPEIRVGKLQNDVIELKPKQKILVVKETVEGNNQRFSITPAIALNFLEPGHQMLFDDGYIISKVIECKKEGVWIEIQNAGLLKSHKGVNLPGANVDLPAMTQQDVADIIFGCQNDIDLIAASFIRSAEHVIEIKKLLAQQKKAEILVIAKIENRLGVENFDNIIQVADGIMVARGDLGVELPLREVPVLQKMMIRKCLRAAKPVVTATQMLESMIKNPRPTRAEVSDVANAIYDSTSAVMLSGETAVGQYPIETVSMMRSIIEETEKDFSYQDFFYLQDHKVPNDISTSISLATVETAYSSGAKAIFVFTSRGSTPRQVSRFRPKMPIIALTPNLKTYHQMALFWGVIPADPSPAHNVQEAFTKLSLFARGRKIVEHGDLVVVTAGSPFGISGTTNMMVVESIGDILVRGHAGKGQKVHGKIAIVVSPDAWREEKIKDRIIVISQCNEAYFPILRLAKGVILQNLQDDKNSEQSALKYGDSLNIPVLVRTEDALVHLQEGMLVVLDPERMIVYQG